MILLVLCFLLDHDAKGTRVNLCYFLLKDFPLRYWLVNFTFRSHLLGGSNVLFYWFSMFGLVLLAQKD